ncbi:MAG: septum formation initiator family protein [Candidatus Endonucleobacter bathymodioli]|uniref:Cell division protein FtsB n=1 Tax=Candidatus Endonucleibacter bathymodioli TaxID=539814 RepID=A0AA90SWK5_9GAMM|nr:septum formation initiator family protein [Candidatus Endonucleobacter bathymodioli]
MYRLFISLLVVILIYLQSQLWFGEGSIAELVTLKETIAHQQLDRDRLYQRNNILAVEVIELQSGLQTIEKEARQELGMVKKDETFYLIYD